MAEKLNRKGQVSIWIILGVILVGSILLFFAISRGPGIINPGSGGVFDMQSFLEQCVKEDVEEVVDLILPHGGFLQPKNSVLYQEIEVEYLCYSNGYYNVEPLGTCVQQHMIKSEIKSEIKKYLDDGRMADCFREMETEFDKRGDLNYENNLPPEVNLDWGPDKIVVEINKETTIENSGEKRRFNNFVVEVKSPAYNLAHVANTIALQQAETCYFEYVGYGLIYPRYDIDLFVMSDSSKVYSITDEDSGLVMNVAVRACASTHGLGGI